MSRETVEALTPSDMDALIHRIWAIGHKYGTATEAAPEMRRAIRAALEGQQSPECGQFNSGVRCDMPRPLGSRICPDCNVDQRSGQSQSERAPSRCPKAGGYLGSTVTGDIDDSGGEPAPALDEWMRERAEYWADLLNEKRQADARRGAEQPFVYYARDALMRCLSAIGKARAALEGQQSPEPTDEEIISAIDSTGLVCPDVGLAISLVRIGIEFMPAGQSQSTQAEEARDAARYRWLRGVVGHWPQIRGEDDYILTGGHADEAIDADIARATAEDPEFVAWFLDGAALPEPPRPAAAPQSSDAQLTDALGYAQRLAQAIHAKHYAEVTQWRVLPDLLGVLTQIDNMTSGLIKNV